MSERPPPARTRSRVGRVGSRLGGEVGPRGRQQEGIGMGTGPLPRRWVRRGVDEAEPGGAGPLVETPDPGRSGLGSSIG